MQISQLEQVKTADTMSCVVHQITGDRPDDWMCEECWHKLVPPHRKWPSLEVGMCCLHGVSCASLLSILQFVRSTGLHTPPYAKVTLEDCPLRKPDSLLILHGLQADKSMFDNASAIGRGGGAAAAAGPSRGARGRRKNGGTAAGVSDRSQPKLVDSMGKGRLQFRRAGARLGRQGAGSGSSGDDWEPEPKGTGRRGGAAARRRAAQRDAATAQQVWCLTPD